MTSLPESYKVIIYKGIPDLNSNDRDDLFPAFFAYRMGKIPGIQNTFFNVI